MAMSLNFDMIDRQPKLNQAIISNPDGVRRLLAVCQHMEQCLHDWADLFHVFFRIDVDIPQLWQSPNMVRRCTLVSDTDSVIFTTDRIVQWYAPQDRFCQDARDINAFSVFMVSQTLEHLFAWMSTGMGMEGNGRLKAKMKNEFYYPIFIRTALRKHYAGIIAIQEGKILPKPKLDIKGVNFRGSEVSAASTKRFSKFVTWTLTELSKTGHIYASELLSHVATHEADIYRSLMKGEKTYLTSTPVKLKEDYDDPETTNYFYYMLWAEVFAPVFGAFELPNKGYIINVVGDGKILAAEPWLESLEKIDPKLRQRFEAFMARYPKKRITRFIIPPSLAEIPEVFRTVLDARRIVFSNNGPFYLLMKSFGLGLTDTSKMLLVSDFMAVEGIDIPLK
jgi:hypothetical protein